MLGNGDWSHLASQHGGLSKRRDDGVRDLADVRQLRVLGLERRSVHRERGRAARAHLPRALLLGTGAVMALYVLLNLVFFYAVPSDVLAGPSTEFSPVIEVGDVAARSLFGDSAGRLVTTVIALALVSSVSAMIMAGPRVYAAMAVDRALPAALAHYNKRGVPVAAVITQGVLAILFVVVGDLGSLIRFVGFTLAIFAALTVGAVFILRRRGHARGVSDVRLPVHADRVHRAVGLDRDRPGQGAAEGEPRRPARDDRRRGAVRDDGARQVAAPRRVDAGDARGARGHGQRRPGVT